MTGPDLLHALSRGNIAAGAAILIVIALRKPTRQIAGARQAYGLWLLPLLALAAVLLPARQVTITLPPLVPRAETGVLIEAGRGVTGLHHLDPSHALVVLWLSGTLIAALVVAVLQFRFSRAAAQGVIGPAVVGVLRPRIIAPPTFNEIFDAREQTLVLAHEEAHIARQDSRINGLSVLFQCLFWFNPLVHLAAHLSRIDQEMACDAAVITRFPDARRAYARALVKAQLATRPLPLGCCWPSVTEHPLEERIAMLKTKTKSRARRLLAGSALVTLCATTGLAAWAAQPPSVAVVHAVEAREPASPALTSPAVLDLMKATAYRPVQKPDIAPAPPPAKKADAAPAPAPAQVSINPLACMPKAGDPRLTSIADAIARGDIGAVVAMGGSGRDVIAAWRANPGYYQRFGGNLGELEAYANVTMKYTSSINANGSWGLFGSDETDSSPRIGLAIPGTARAEACVPKAPPTMP